MKLSGEGTLVRIFIGESDKHSHQALYDAIVREAKAHGIAGATVVRGVEGYGATSRVIHSAKIMRLSEDLPILIEIVDTKETIDTFLPQIEKLIEESHSGALITLESVHILRYSSGKQ